MRLRRTPAGRRTGRAALPGGDIAGARMGHDFPVWIGVGGDGKGTQHRGGHARDHEPAEDLVLGVEKLGEQQAKQQRKLKKR